MGFSLVLNSHVLPTVSAKFQYVTWCCHWLHLSEFWFCWSGGWAGEQGEGVGQHIWGKPDSLPLVSGKVLGSGAYTVRHGPWPWDSHCQAGKSNMWKRIIMWCLTRGMGGSLATSSGWRTPVGVLWGHQEARKERKNKGQFNWQVVGIGGLGAKPCWTPCAQNRS